MSVELLCLQKGRKILSKIRIVCSRRLKSRREHISLGPCPVSAHMSGCSSASERLMTSGAVSSRGASQPATDASPIDGCSGERGRGHVEFHEKLSGVDAQWLNASELLVCPPCNLQHRGAAQWFAPCTKPCGFPRRAGGSWPCGAPCVDVKNHEGGHRCHQHGGILHDDWSTYSPMATEQTDRQTHGEQSENQTRRQCFPRKPVIV